MEFKVVAKLRLQGKYFQSFLHKILTDVKVKCVSPLNYLKTIMCIQTDIFIY